jgi:5,5'-dehydrodivanillate O-demethylase
MLTAEQNARLTQVGPGTPAGALLRSYWQPVAAAGELTTEKPIKRVRILGENLVVYRDTAGKYGLVGERCPHRSASLAYGKVEADGIRCPYHGWKFAGSGACIEQPAEPKDSTYKDQIEHPGYPVEMLGGMLFAYFGAGEAPPIPHWDVLAWTHGRRWVQIQSMLNCNWLQAMENSVDPSHLYWLHGQTGHLAKMMEGYEEEHEFIDFDYGIMKRRITPPSKPGGKPQVDQHPLLFPNTLRHVHKKDGNIRHNLQIRVPVDDTHTQIYVVIFEPTPDVQTAADQIVPWEVTPMKDEDGDYRMDMVLAQDVMAWETQGPVTDRSQEHLGSADKGVVKFRRLISDQIDLVEAGKAPLGTVKDADKGRLIELDVTNERIGIFGSARQGAASAAQ